MLGSPLSRKVATVYLLLIAGNVAAWLWALTVFRDRPVLLGTALLAYSLGLRHGFDADHIAAIDNVTRKLMQEGGRPVSAGLFFALGHSTVVVALSGVIALSAAPLEDHFDFLRSLGGIVGTSASAVFLLAIAVANLVILMRLRSAFRAATTSGQVAADVDLLAAKRGFLARLFRPVFALVGHSWHMYPVGVVFGLGFDTATEIGLLGITAAQAAQGLSIWSVLIFPALFTAGMTLVDMTDSVMMVGAYGWAFVRPIRKLYYNLTITFVSVVAALFLGSVEALGLIGGAFALHGPFWGFIDRLNNSYGILGYAIVAFFLASWLVSVVAYRAKGYDRLPVSG